MKKNFELVCSIHNRNRATGKWYLLRGFKEKMWTSLEATASMWYERPRFGLKAISRTGSDTVLMTSTLNHFLATNHTMCLCTCKCVQVISTIHKLNVILHQICVWLLQLLPWISCLLYAKKNLLKNIVSCSWIQFLFHSYYLIQPENIKRWSQKQSASAAAALWQCLVAFNKHIYTHENMLYSLSVQTTHTQHPNSSFNHVNQVVALIQ